MPDCQEDVKAIYSHATMTEAMMATTDNKDRELIIVTDFDPSTVEQLDDCTGNNYILVHEFCDPNSNYIKTRRNFVSYEALAAIGDDECNGASLVNVDSHYEYEHISLLDSFSLQDALMDLDIAISNSSTSALQYLKDGPLPASLISSDGVNDAQIVHDDTGSHVTNLGDSNSVITTSSSKSFSVIGNGTSNEIDGPYNFIANGDTNKIVEEAEFSMIGNGESNKIEAGSSHLILNGSNNQIVPATV